MQERQETQAQSLCREDPSEEGMATHSRILAGRISQTEEPGGLQSVESHRVRHNQGDSAHKVRPGLRHFRCSLFGQCGFKKKKQIAANYFRRFHRINCKTTGIYL